MESIERNKVYFVILFAVIGMILIAIYICYAKYNYLSYTKTEYIAHGTKFTRDNKIKTSKTSSYKLESKDYNDAMFYRTIKVEKNTPYKVTCKIKTENVVTQEDVSIAGAHISIADTTEKSKAVVGTEDWQKIEFLFDSKDREEVKLGFRLGSYEDNCKGTAWFSDFTIESGIKNTNTEWNFAFLLLPNIDTTIGNTGEQNHIKKTITPEEMQVMQENIKRFEKTIGVLSNYNMSANVDTYIIDENISSLSYSDENGYYIEPKNIQKVLEQYSKIKEFDYIFVITSLEDESKRIQDINKQWSNIGGMEYQGIGFSNIRISHQKSDFQYDAITNTFPEQPFVNEFLLFLEKASKERKYAVPNLKDNEKYGYQSDKTSGLRKWYAAYMTKTIIDNTKNETLGLDPMVYQARPPHESDFEYHYSMNSFKE